MAIQQITGAASIAGLLALGGLGGLGLAVRLSSRRLGPFERGVLFLVWGPLFLSVLALALADAGGFRLRTLLAGAAVWGATGLAALLRDNRLRKDGAAEENAGRPAPFLLGVAAILVAAGILITPAHTYLFGGWDPGEYVCTAANVARTGALAIQDPVLPGLSPAERTVLMHEPNPPRRTLQAGYLVIDAEKGRLMPDYYHLYPAWLAVWVKLFGLAGAWSGHTALALFALGMVMLAAGSLFGRRTALLAGAALAACPAQAYMMRFTTAEMLTQFCLFGGFWALDRALRKPGGAGFAATAGAAFGAALLAHGTAVLPVAGVLIFLGARALVRREPEAWGLAAVAGAGAALALAWNGIRAEVMTGFLWGHMAAHPARWALAAALGILAAGAGWLAARRGATRTSGRRWEGALRWLPLALALLLAVLGYAVRPRLGTGPDAKNLPYFAALLGLPGAIGAVAFFGLKRWTDWTAGQKAFLAAGLMTAGVLLVNKMVQPVYLWAARRWVPVVFPFAAILAAETAIWLMRLGRKGSRDQPEIGGRSWAACVRTAAGPLLGAALVAGWFSGMRPRTATVCRGREYDGLPAFMGKLAAAVGDADAVLCWHAEPATPLRYLFNIPAFTLSRLPERGGIREAHTATALLRRWAGEGKRVYWIGDGFYDPSLSLVATAEIAGQFQILERRIDRLPRVVIPESRTFQIYRVEPALRRAWTTPLSLDVGYSAMGLAGGFYGLERDWDGPTRFGFRETNGRGRLYLPAIPGAWRIRMKQFNRDAETLPVRLLAEGRELALHEVGREWKEYRFTLPTDLGTNGVVLLEIVSPSRGSGKWKKGVAVDRLMCDGN